MIAPRPPQHIATRLQHIRNTLQHMCNTLQHTCNTWISAPRTQRKRACSSPTPANRWGRGGVSWKGYNRGGVTRLQQRWGEKVTRPTTLARTLPVPWHTWQTWHTRQTWQIAMCHQGYEGDKLQCITHKTHSNISQVAGSQPKCHQACTKYVSPSMCHEATCLSSSSRHLFRAYAISPRRRITHHTYLHVASHTIPTFTSHHTPYLAWRQAMATFITLAYHRNSYRIMPQIHRIRCIWGMILYECEGHEQR